jgi:hypothetical protein
MYFQFHNGKVDFGQNKTAKAKHKERELNWQESGLDWLPTNGVYSFDGSEKERETEYYSR